MVLVKRCKDGALCAKARQQFVPAMWTVASRRTTSSVHYIYALLHHAGLLGVRSRGRVLARLHVKYEWLDPWPLECLENKDVPDSEGVVKMRLSADKQSVRVNDSPTLAGIRVPRRWTDGI